MMWWKLGILGVATVALIFCVIPIRTHAVLVDPANPPPPHRWRPSTIMKNMYFTRGTIALIELILIVASLVGAVIIRGS